MLRRELTEKDLSHWKLLARFQEVMGPVMAKARLPATFSHPQRKLGYAPYLSLFLFGMFNPVVKSMRALCEVSRLQKVQQEIGCRSVSLGSFSEMQAVLDPDLLKQVFEDLVQQSPADSLADPRLAHLQLFGQDGSLWSALPRMTWAEYGVGWKGEANGVRLHWRFDLLKDQADDALVTPGKGSETKALRDLFLPGQTTVADRFYGQDYKLFRQIDQGRAFFVFRIQPSAVVHGEEELPVSAAEKAAGVVRHAWVHLGATEKLRSMRLRLVEVRRDGQHLLLVTNHAVETISAELVSVIYRRRWAIELFFRWIKCILGHRHFFAESPEGVALQMYLALIAALLLQGLTGRRPNKRMMELLQFYMLGWATAEEVVAGIQRPMAKAEKVKRA